MRTDHLHNNSAENSAMPEELAGLRYGTVEDLHRQLEIYAEAFSALLSAMDEGAVRIGRESGIAASPLSKEQSC